MEKAHSCVAAYVKGRRARHWLPPHSGQNANIADIITCLYLHSPTLTMAMGKGRTEVPDSEDEPMTSSPVNISDGAADKLSTPAPVPLQDAQDALQEAARTNQAIDESVANSPGDGLGADQENASLDVDAPEVDQTNVQLEVTASGDRHDEAHQRTPIPSSEALSSPESQDDGMGSQPHSTATTSASNDQQQTDHQMTTELVATTASATDMTLLASEVDVQNNAKDAKDQPGHATHELTLDLAEPSSDEAKGNASSITDTGQTLLTRRVAIDSFISDNNKLKKEDDVQSAMSGALHDVLNKPVSSQSEKPSNSDHTPQMEEHAVSESHQGPNHEVALEKPNVVTPPEAEDDAERSQGAGQTVCSWIICLHVIMLTFSLVCYPPKSVLGRAQQYQRHGCRNDRL